MRDKTPNDRAQFIVQTLSDLGVEENIYKQQLEQDKEKKYEDYFDKILPGVLLQSYKNYAKYMSMEGIFTVNADYNRINGIGKLYLQGYIQPNVWQEEIWKKLSLTEKTFELTNLLRFDYPLAQDNAAVVKQIGDCYLELLQDDSNKNDKDQKFLKDLHTKLLSAIKFAVAHAPSNQPSACLPILLNLLRQTALTKDANANLQTLEVYTGKHENISENGVVILTNGFESLYDVLDSTCCQYFYAGARNEESATANLRAYVSFLKSSLPPEEFEPFIKSFKNEHLATNLFSRKYIQSWSAFFLEPEAATLKRLRPENVDPNIEKIDKAVDTLMLSIQKLRDYGIELEQKGSEKGEYIVALAQSLETYVNDLSIVNPTRKEFVDLEEKFNSQIKFSSKVLASPRPKLNTILINVFAALTVLGALILAGHLIYTKITQKRALFFGQKPTTTSEDIVKKVSEDMEDLVKPMKKEQ